MDDATFTEAYYKTGRRALGCYRATGAAAAIALLALAASPAYATNVTLVGLIGSKAIVVIDRGAPRTLAPGQKSAEGVLLLATERNAATFEIDGKTRTLQMGQAYAAAGPSRQSVTLNADASGHIFTVGSINGGSVRLLVDTGATLIVLPAAEAKRLGIDYLKAPPVRMNTANGVALAYRVQLDSVRIGDVELNNVDALVNANDNLGVTLLGMSFLNRMEMKREGQRMTLTKRF